MSAEIMELTYNYTQIHSVSSVRNISQSMDTVIQGCRDTGIHMLYKDTCADKKTVLFVTN